MASYVLTIGGKATAAPRSFKVLNPVDESVVAECPEGTIALVDLAVESARKAAKQLRGIDSGAALENPHLYSLLHTLSVIA